MSDSNAPGEPVEPTAETASVDDVVGQANEGLADAEAAGRDAVDATEPAAPEPAAPEPVAEPEPIAEAASSDVTAYAEPEPGPAATDIPWYERDDVPLDEPAATAVIEPDQPTVVAPAVAPAPRAQQPIFVQAPEPPRPRGNRAAAGAIGLLAALCFGVLYLGVGLSVGLVDGSVTGANIAEKAVAALGTWALWIPVAVFFVAFWLLGAIVNRGRWGLWVVFGLLVGIVSYGGHLLGQLFQASFWTLTSSQGQELVKGQLLVPLAIAAFVIGRELTIWFGAWIAARGKRITELNYEAQREYERTLEAGPTIVHSAQG